MRIRRTLKIILLIILILLILFMAFIMVIVPSIEVIDADVVVLGAHRGNSLEYVENTLPAFESAVNQSKYMFIEFDVQYTKDKQLIVHHDKSLFRLQHKLHWIDKMDYEELLDVSDYHIPLYEEVMEIVAGKKPLNIELKSQGNIEDDKKAIDYIIEDCKKRGILESTLISSISSDVLEYVNENYDVRTGKIYYIDESTFFHFDIFTRGMYEELERTNTDYLMLHGSNLRNYNSIRNLLPNDKTLAIWYYNDEMYVIEPKEREWVFRLKVQSPTKALGTFKAAAEKILKVNRDACIWWC